MSSTPKLTKRQKKGIAFRDRKQGKGKGKLNDANDNDDLENENDVPLIEDQVHFDGTQGSQGGQGSTEDLGAKGKRREKREKGEEGVVVAAKKRKREVGEEPQEPDGEPDKQKSKRRKGSAGVVVVAMGQAVEGEGDGKGKEGGRGEEKSKQRFILFLGMISNNVLLTFRGFPYTVPGNLKYTTTLETIQAHFSACDPPPTVRLLTPKPSTTKPSTKPVIKSKGCAFLEFKHRNALQQGLKLHHSQLDGRQINVELTAGGGGKGEARLNKLKERNKELYEQRRIREDKKKSSDDSLPTERPEGAQRISKTSGVEQVPTKKRTWTVGDVEETETHRGGQKHTRGSKKRKLRAKDWGTGVNAIPVG
ncbi:hypothetical protein HYDPIDRAFT_167349 [Hydnomerulius pinastri MD-312]|uniref:RRM domain-containing protein n=1 Tax=Hydnomerulius pinastri MD-312 TaxID=994086 RepID=A0A0C9WFQ0_9AGAM|nr:hypothetical protein HYDPIDRAFT_167349 [Hydnomerulius pinastri MD-312]